jgi:hypothetical protein
LRNISKLQNRLARRGGQVKVKRREGKKAEEKIGTITIGQRGSI